MNTIETKDAVKFLSERKKEKHQELQELKNKLSLWWFQTFCFFEIRRIKKIVAFYEKVILPEYETAIDELKKGNRNLAHQLMQKITESIAFQNFRDYGFRESSAVRRNYEKALMIKEALAR